MTIDEIQTEWAADTQIDPCDLKGESLKIPQLHSKYYNMYLSEIPRLKKFQLDYHKLYRDKYEYFMSGSTAETVKRGWEKTGNIVAKEKINMYMQSDDEVIALSLKVDMQQEKIEFLKSILSELMYNRKLVVGNAIKMHIFEGGGG